MGIVRRINDYKKDKVKKRNTFFSQFVRGAGFAHAIFNKTEIKAIIKNRSDLTSITGLSHLDIYLYYLIQYVDTWDRNKIKEELSDMRFEIQSMRNYEQKCNDTRERNMRRLSAAYSIAKGKPILRKDGHMLDDLGMIVKRFSEEENKLVDDYIKKYYDAEYEENSFLSFCQQASEVVKK